jgi:hypothetical protein
MNSKKKGAKMHNKLECVLSQAKEQTLLKNENTGIKL